jgi:superfamily II DNA or RNA helicase
LKLPFGRRPRSNTGPQFHYEYDGDRLRLRLQQSGRPARFSEWLNLRPDAAAGINAIELASQDAAGQGLEGLDPDATDILLEPSLVARMDASTASVLGLPSPTFLGLDLKPLGLISDDGFTLQTRWVRPGGQPVLSEVFGAIIRTAEGDRRIPEPIWSLLRAASKLAQPLERSERFAALADLRAHWPEDPRAAVDAEPYLRDLRVHYASAFSLKLRTLTPDQTEFDPVLFGARALSEAVEDGRALDEEVDNVLTPDSQKLFAEDRFRREPQARSVYVLQDGEYVYIDPALRPVLDIVRRIQDRPESERRDFILGPRKFLRDRLGEEESERLELEALFVETEQFSSRVAGVDVWRTPVLPWLTPSEKNNWLPERFGIRIGDEYFVLPPENAAVLLERLEQAQAKGEPTVEVGDLLEPREDSAPHPPATLVVNEQTIAAARVLAPLGAMATAGGDLVGETGPPSDTYGGGKLFLVVRENFENVEFSPAAGNPGGETVDAPVAVPSVLRTSLKPHQSEGLNWLASAARSGRPGALLADDMGLGKTLQAIAFMAWLRAEAEEGRRPTAPFLIVAPTGLLGTWKGEIGRHLLETGLGELVPAFGADLRYLRQESGLSTRDIETGRASLRNEAWREAGVVLTTYETMRDYHFSFARTRFGLIVYDEIQKLKNPTSQMTRAAKALNSAFTLGMTGTPVENRLQDIWSIMDVISPGFLGASRDFEKRFPPNDQVALGRLKAQLTEPHERRPPYMLRRMKTEGFEGLPRKFVHKAEAEMPAAQARAYRDLVVRAATASSAGNIGRGGMLATLAAMRGVSLHPLDPRQAPDDLDTYAQDSARLSATLSILDDVAAKDEKALIFVESLAMQERLASLIKSRFRLRNLPHRINGGVPGQRRQVIVNEFEQNRERFDVMILSPRAGGVGLTITSANHVIHLSRWWNPAVEDQATDRVFRIGQTRDVHVYLPLAVHPDPSLRSSSFDLRLNSLMERKRQLTRDLLLPPEAAEGELGELFREVSLGGTTESTAQAEPVPAPSTTPAPVPPLPPSPRSSSPPEPVTTGNGVSNPRPKMTLPQSVTEVSSKVWRVKPAQPRPTGELLEIFRGRDIVTVEIRDPYALAHVNARAAQIRFLADLSKVARTLEAATIEYAPEVEGDVAESAARRNVGELLALAFPKNSPRLSLSRRPRRGPDDDFHDRTVELFVRHSGGAIRQHWVTIGRGIEALYEGKWQCNATYVPPSD